MIFQQYLLCILPIHFFHFGFNHLIRSHFFSFVYHIIILYFLNCFKWLFSLIFKIFTDFLDLFHLHLYFLFVFIIFVLWFSSYLNSAFWLWKSLLILYLINLCCLIITFTFMFFLFLIWWINWIEYIWNLLFFFWHRWSAWFRRWFYCLTTFF